MDPSGITYDETTLVSSEINTKYRTITLTFAKPHLLVKFIEYNSTTYVSFASQLLPLYLFLQVRTALEKPKGLTVEFGPDYDSIRHTYKDLTAATFATIMSAVEAAIEEYNLPTDAPEWLITDSESEDEPGLASTILDRAIPPPNPDTLESPNSTPLTRADQVAFLVGILAFLIAILHSVYLAITTTIKLV